MESIKKVLMRRDNMSEEEAEDLIDQAKSDLADKLDAGEMPFDICEDWFGLDEKYIDELMWKEKPCIFQKKKSEIQ